MRFSTQKKKKNAYLFKCKEMSIFFKGCKEYSLFLKKTIKNHFPKEEPSFQTILFKDIILRASDLSIAHLN